MKSSFESDAKVFKALCDPRRLEILEKLRGGEKCVCVLLEDMDIGQSCLSYHLKVLSESGIVESRQDGKWTYYHLSEAGSESAAALLRKLTTPDSDRECDCIQNHSSAKCRKDRR